MADGVEAPAGMIFNSCMRHGEALGPQAVERACLLLPQLGLLLTQTGYFQTVRFALLGALNLKELGLLGRASVFRPTRLCSR